MSHISVGRGRVWLSVALTVLLLAAVVIAVGLSAGAAAKPGRNRLAPVGIVSAVGYEQAPILASMHVAKTVRLSGYTFYVGTIAGRPVVDVLGFEDDESSELATYLLATRFRVRALVFSGTAGSQSRRVDVGDVVLSGFVADKENVHYQTGGYQSSNKGRPSARGPWR
jgi:adenosylhomocysteine nucleosidase